MTQPSSNNNNIPKQPSDPIVTTSLSKSSLNSSSTLSVSPSTSVLLSTSRPRNSYRTSKTPSIPQPSTSSSSKNSKLEQIIQNFYAKTAQIIIQSRISNERLKGGYNTRRKINKWFNITTNDSENLKEELKFWKSFIKNHQDEEPPPLVIDIYLETTEPELLQEGDNIRGWRKLDLNVQRILIESWTLSLSHPLPEVIIDLPNLYKRSIIFFRSLHSLVRLLPSHNLYKRLSIHDGEISLGYRLSTHSVHHPDEIPLDHPLTNIDTTQLYEFKEVVTPLGIFKLKLLYRKYCQFDTKEDSNPVVPSSLQQTGIDVEENYFTPTMTKYRQETKAQPPTTIYPSLSSSSSRSRIQSFRSTPSRNPYPTSSTSTTTSLERRISAPIVQPFKSPSLSSSPQTELMYPSRSQTPENKRPESGSFGRKIEFSSSFEKFKNLSSSNHSHRTSLNMAPDMARRGSRTSDHSSIYMESEEEEDLQDFMKFIGEKQELKIFQQIGSIYTEKEVTPQEETKKTLSHFRNIQETHNIFSIQQKETESSSKGLNLPVKPSPLHNTESVITDRSIKPNYFRDFQHPYQLDVDIVTQSPLKNRQAPPLPPPPSLLNRNSHSSGTVDDDDSLVFKMSDLSSSGIYEKQEGEEYLKRLKKIDSCAMRRINSSGNIPSSSKKEDVQSGHYSDDNSSSIRHKLTHRLFYDPV